MCISDLEKERRNARMIQSLHIPAMRNASHVRAVTEALRRVRGVLRVQPVLATRTVSVQHTAAVDVAALLAALRRAGYTDVSVLV
jgi:copper chaperone CopZ